MTTDQNDQCDGNIDETNSALEKFIQAVEKRISNPHHHRLLKVCLEANPSAALEKELRTIASEIINET